MKDAYELRSTNTAGFVNLSAHRRLAISDSDSVTSSSAISARQEQRAGRPAPGWLAEMASPPAPRRVCVTGGAGYIASWLIKLLLSRGYAVHATVRDPSKRPAAALMLFLLPAAKSPSDTERLRVPPAEEQLDRRLPQGSRSAHSLASLIAGEELVGCVRPS